MKLLVFCLAIAVTGCGGGGSGTTGLGGAIAPITASAAAGGTVPVAATASQDTNPALPGIQANLVVTGLTPNTQYQCVVKPSSLQNSTESEIVTAISDAQGTATFQNLTWTNGRDFQIKDMQGTVVLTLDVTAPEEGGATNRNPTASAGQPQTVTAGTQVTLTASATDADGDTLAYAWTQVSGATVTLAGASTATATFTPSAAGSFVFRVTVSDGKGGSATADVTITVNAQQNLHEPPAISAAAMPSPVVAATPTPSVPVLTNVTLRATAQLFDNATVATVLWEQTSPASPTLTINSASALVANVTPASAGTYTFKVTVTDSKGGVGTASVTLTVTPANAKPVAIAGAPQYGVGYGQQVTLAGSGTDPDGNALTYRWTQGANDLVKVTLSSSTVANPTFTTGDIPTVFSAAKYPLSTTEYGVLGFSSNAAGTYNFTLTVQDPSGLTATNTVEVLSAWRSNGTTSGEVGAHLYLVAPVASSYSWTVVERPAQSTAQFDSATVRFPRFVPDKVGKYVFKEGTRANIAYNASTFVGQENCAACHGPDASQPDKLTTFLKTSHATTLKRRLNQARATSLTSFRSRTVGFNPTVTAVSGWDDDYAEAVSKGFSLPASTPLNYYDSTFPAELKVLANQQCETCHGPGNNHNGNKGKIAKTLKVEVCGQCHGTQPAELAKAGHATIVASPASRNSCSACHNGPAYIAVTSAFPTTGTIKAWASTTDWMSTAASQKTTTGFGASAHTCAVCHDPHDAPSGDSFTDFQLRVYDRDITLRNGMVVKNTGTSATCITCHHARTSVSTIPTAVVTTVTGTTTKTYGSRLGMHYSPQADVLFGANGYEVPGQQYSNSEHKNVVKHLCIECHMAKQGSGVAEAGGHTWRMKKADGSNNAAVACASCHTGLTTYDRITRDDYDGDGTIEGIQSEVHGLLEHIDQAMEAATVKVTINGVEKSAWAHYKATEYAYQLTVDQMKAAWNWRLVEEDRSFGVHNAAYTVQLLQHAYKLVTGHDVPNATLRSGRNKM